MMVYESLQKYCPLKEMFWDSNFLANFILLFFIDGYSGGHKHYFRKIGQLSVNIYYFCCTFCSIFVKLTYSEKGMDFCYIKCMPVQMCLRMF